MPDPALITSIMTWGSSPDLTPITTASAVAAMAVADKKLLASFMVCPEPGFSPMKNTLPMLSSAGLTASASAFGPDTITASVPFSAPPTPPLTGLSICTMSRCLSKSWIRTAICEPTVDRSTKRLTRLPSITPLAPVATSSEACSEGRLAITVSTRSATSLGEAAAYAPIATSLSTASLRVSNTTSWCLASIRRRAMGKPIFPRPINPMSMVMRPQPLSNSANTSRAIRKLSTPAGTPA